MPTGFSKGKLVVVALVLVILTGAGITYAYETMRNDSSLTLNGTYNIAPDSYIEKTFNVSVSGHSFNIETVNDIKAKNDFALLVLPDSYAGKSNTTIGIICNSGERSYYACSFLMENKIKNVFNVRGGIIRWHLSGLDVDYD